MIEKDAEIICDTFSDFGERVCEWMYDNDQRWCLLNCEWTCIQPECLQRFVKRKKKVEKNER